MLNTVIDFEIFDDFCNTMPKQIPEGSEDDNYCWNSFWKFLRSGSNVTIINYKDKEQPNIFLTGLTNNRNGTKVEMSQKYNLPNKNTFPEKTNKRTVFFLHETSADSQSNFRKKNGLLIGFLHDYKDKWKELSLIGKDTVLPVRKGEQSGLQSWEQISGYLTPFTDIIIADNYILDENLWDSNLFELLKQFQAITQVEFNLTLISFPGKNNPPIIDDINSKMNKKLKEHSINCNLCIVFTKQTLKEHDRSIFSNYLRITSGDSFNYFKSNGDYCTKGTDIHFDSMAEVDKCKATEAALRNIKSIIEELENETDKEKYIKGKPSKSLFPSL